MLFLDAERAIAVRWAERERVRCTQNKQAAASINSKPQRQTVKTLFGEMEVDDGAQEVKMYCVIHKTKNHSLSVCKSFLGLPVKKHYELV